MRFLTTLTFVEERRSVSINSDSDERMRRLNLDAAKVEKYGGVPEQDALQMITLNPAKQLGIDKRTGSIEVGKDGDLVIWNGHPFSVFSRVETTIIEGEAYFDRAKDAQMRLDMTRERETLEKLDVNRPPATGGGPPRVPAEKRRSERDEADYDGGNHIMNAKLKIQMSKFSFSCLCPSVICGLVFYPPSQFRPE